MLVKITPEQIAREWLLIRHAITQSLPPIAPGAQDQMSNLLNALMLDQLHCWCSIDDAGNLQAIVITKITQDEGSGIRTLLIYCMYSFIQLTKPAFAEGLVILRRFAQSKGCVRIAAYTAEKSIIDFFKRIGGDTKYTFVSLKVGEQHEDL